MKVNFLKRPVIFEQWREKGNSISCLVFAEGSSVSSSKSKDFRYI